MSTIVADPSIIKSSRVGGRSPCSRQKIIDRDWIAAIIMMKLTVWLLLVSECASFAPAFLRPRSSSSLAASTAAETKREGGVADELGIPCELECQIEAYPNLPDSVHPGVLSGKAMMDLLEDAKAKGTFLARMMSPSDAEWR